MNIKTEFDVFLDQIRPHILELLEAEGYNTSGAIKCINPDHNDQNPSLLVGQAQSRGWTIWCSGCGKHYDIFDVYSILHDKPSRGPGWMKEVVIPLAERFGIDPPVIELSPAQQFTHDLYRTYEDVAGLLNHNIEKMDISPQKYVQAKQWTEKTLGDLDIGTLSFETLRSKISQEDRSRFGLDRTDVFNNDCLIFTVRDVFGRPVRFFARKPEGHKPKFTSTSTNNMAVDLWRDEGILYGIHLIRKDAPVVLLVEGQPDVATAYQNNLGNVVGLCGCESFSEYHADALALQGISRVIIGFDGDEAGQTATQKLLQKPFARAEGLYYEVLPLPDEHDPDSYIREEGIEQFQNLLQEMRISAFEFLLNLRNPSDPIETIVKELIPHIAANSSDILREKMARELSLFMKGEISVGSILSDVRRVDHIASTRTMERRKSVIKATTRMAESNPGEAEEVYKQGLEQLQEIDKRETSTSEVRNKVLSRIQATKMAEERRVAGGFEVIPGRMTNLTDILEGGSWRGKRLVIVGAIQNMGKSSFVDDLMWQIVSNPKNNAIGYWLTLDDSVEDRQRRLQTCAIGSPNFSMNMVSNPHYYAEECGIPEVYETREASYARLVEQVAAGRIIIEGSQDGTTVSYAIKRIQQIRRENPEKNILFCLDNLHDVEDYPALDQRSRVTNIIKTIRKRIVDAERVTAICTAEYRKGDPEVPGTDEDLADARALKFAPHLTIHLFSDCGAGRIAPEDAIMVHNYGGEIRPRVIAGIGKNKITKFKGKKLYFDFHPESSLFLSVPTEVAISEAKDRKAFLDAVKSRGSSQDEEDYSE